MMMAYGLGRITSNITLFIQPTPSFTLLADQTEITRCLL